MRSLSFLLIAGILSMATGCGRAHAQQVPGDSGITISDALKRDTITRDAASVLQDGGK